MTSLPPLIERRLAPRIPTGMGTKNNVVAFLAPPEAEPRWNQFVQAAVRMSALRGESGPALSDWRQLVLQMNTDIRDHAYQVAGVTVAIGRAMGMSRSQIDDLRLGALLHDVGKLAVPQAILAKEGPLDKAEWRVIRRHPGYAREMLSAVHARKDIVDAAYSHHERWDGDGYPRGLRGTVIPMAARIVSVADVVDALSSKRAYRGAWTEQAVRMHVADGAGKQFDPGVVEAYLGLQKAA